MKSGVWQVFAKKIGRSVLFLQTPCRFGLQKGLISSQIYTFFAYLADITTKDGTPKGPNEQPKTPNKTLTFVLSCRMARQNEQSGPKGRPPQTPAAIPPHKQVGSPASPNGPYGPQCDHPPHTPNLWPFFPLVPFPEKNPPTLCHQAQCVRWMRSDQDKLTYTQPQLQGKLSEHPIGGSHQLQKRGGVLSPAEKRGTLAPTRVVRDKFAHPGARSARTPWVLAPLIGAPLLEGLRLAPW